MIKLINGDSKEVLKEFPDNYFDSVVTDPPYGLTSIVKRFKDTSIAGDTQTEQDAKERKTPYSRTSRGFMGKAWDGSGIEYDIEFWKEVYRVLKPGGHVLAMSSTRTYHRVATAIEDAGFEIRDTLTWLTGQGFPKSLDISKQIDKVLKHDSESSAKYVLRSLREAYLPKTVHTTEEQGEILQSLLQEQSLLPPVGDSIPDVWRKESSMEGWSDIQVSEGELQKCKVCKMSSVVFRNGEERWLCNGTPFDYGTESWKNFNAERSCTSYRPQSIEQQDRKSNVISRQQIAQNFRGYGTALKPACEFICLARKPISEKNIALNVLKWGTGGINIDDSRIELNGEIIPINVLESWSGFGEEDRPAYTPTTNTKGRFPANVILDEEAGEILDEQSGILKSGSMKKEYNVGSAGEDGFMVNHGIYNKYKARPYQKETLGSIGGASRFFYCAKASPKERKEYNTHATVKPIALMEYLIKLITPANGIVLEPFMGSGTTILACKRLGYSVVGIELEKDSFDISVKRLEELE